MRGLEQTKMRGCIVDDIHVAKKTYGLFSSPEASHGRFGMLRPVL